MEIAGSPKSRFGNGFPARRGIRKKGRCGANKLLYISGWWQLKYFLFSPLKLGRWSNYNLTDIFQMGWNQVYVLVKMVPYDMESSTQSRKIACLSWWFIGPLTTLHEAHHSVYSSFFVAGELNISGLTHPVDWSAIGLISFWCIMHPTSSKPRWKCSLVLKALGDRIFWTKQCMPKNIQTRNSLWINILTWFTMIESWPQLTSYA